MFLQNHNLKVLIYLDIHCSPTVFFIPIAQLRMRNITVKVDSFTFGQE